ncbi:MAG: hypothetical protein WBN20_14575 [Eudoraea sp.]|uniref:hypothetical protein n=3 Tax=Eudoraea sp. TaxID=1979955 RepID=UPI003C761FA3
MKTASQILMLMAIISFMSCGQLHVVTLYVDTKEIKKDNIDINNDSLNKYAHFNQPKGISNKHFTTHVRRGDRIIWDAVSSSNPSDEVKIIAINHISGEIILKRKSPTSQPQSFTTKSGIVKTLFAGTIKKRPVERYTYIQEIYEIKFTVTDKEGTFTIDPKIRSYQ